MRKGAGLPVGTNSAASAERLDVAAEIVDPVSRTSPSSEIGVRGWVGIPGSGEFMAEASVEAAGVVPVLGDPWKGGISAIVILDAGRVCVGRAASRSRANW